MWPTCGSNISKDAQNTALDTTPSPNPNSTPTPTHIYVYELCLEKNRRFFLLLRKWLTTVKIIQGIIPRFHTFILLIDNNSVIRGKGCVHVDSMGMKMSENIDNTKNSLV